MKFIVISVKIKSILPRIDVPLLICCCNNDHKMTGPYLEEMKHRTMGGSPGELSEELVT